MLAADRQEAIGEAVNIGNEREITILQLAQMIKSITGSNSEIVTQPYHDYYGQNYEDTPRRQPDVRKAKKVLGFSADTSLETGLKETIDWCRENYSVGNS
jgi:UDP-glucose 4-epimerase